LEIAKQIAGFTPAEADDLKGDRQEDPRADGVPQGEVPRGLRARPADARRSPTSSGRTWRQSQDYSFNKSHAACYALIAYRTAWLKAHHPKEYMAALISSVMNTKDRVPFYVNACREIDIEVLPPDVNGSECDFAVVEGRSASA
jgi:DNA polymerase-3 subunit alpha